MYTEYKNKLYRKYAQKFKELIPLNSVNIP